MFGLVRDKRDDDCIKTGSSSKDRQMCIVEFYTRQNEWGKYAETMPESMKVRREHINEEHTTCIIWAPAFFKDSYKNSTTHKMFIPTLYLRLSGAHSMLSVELGG